MPTTRPWQLTYRRLDAGAEPASTAVVPLVASTQWAPPAARFPSPDPTFVTQLIASAEQLAERRRWPRDRAADASSAYAHPHLYGTGLKTRQTI
jgi:hypothetical protein